MPVLEFRNVGKSFFGNRVLSDINLAIEAGEVHALVGENGAGKSTLVNLAAGVHARDSGEIMLQGEPVSFADPLHAMRAGISVVHQELSLAPNATVAENIHLRREVTNRFGLNDWRAMNRRTAAVFRRIGIDIDPAELVGRLSVGMQQLVEIAKAIALEARIIFMDEPTSSLSEREIDDLFRVVRGLRAQGIAVVFISHKLSELFDIADRISVLRDGRLIGTRPAREVQSAEIIRMMVGRALEDLYPPHASAQGPVLFTCRGLSRYGYVADIDFDVRRGEIVGLAGLIGAGRSEAMRALINADRRSGGRFTLNGQEIALASPVEAVRHGIYYVSEDRKSSGLFLPLSVALNVAASTLGRLSTGLGMLRAEAVRRQAAAAIADLDIRPPNGRAAVISLSGGNQQKVLLGKALATNPALLVADEPTRGVDVGAKATIHRRLRAAAEAGAGVVLISSEMPEVIGLADRILVFRSGRISGELDNRDGRVRQEDIMYLATWH